MGKDKDNNNMRVYQIVTTLSYGDAVGNDVLALDDALRRHGYKTCIYAEHIDYRINRKQVKKISKLKKLKKDDLIVYHFAIATELNTQIKNYPCKIIMRYHNITPYHFFKNYSQSLTELCRQGRDQLEALKDDIQYCIADSEYNKNDLRELGFTGRIDVLPILIPFSDYEKEPDQYIVRQYRDDGYVNILFTGRIAPNKKQEDVIAAFYMYQKYYNPKSRLFVVGSYAGMESYYNRVKQYAEKLGVENVFFTGHIKFDKILAYYSIADLFLCMSEHEGFCVPIVESMFFGIPIIAYESTAVVDTLGGAGILLKEKKPLETAGMIDYIMNHPELRDQMVQAGRKRLEDFEHDKVEQQFLNCISEYAKG